MAEDSKDEGLTPVEPRPTKGEPIAPGDPVMVESIMDEDPKKPGANSTFGSRAKAVSSSQAENKAVGSASTKRKK